MKKIEFSFLLAAALAVPATAAAAEDGPQAGFRISLTIPEVCELDFQGASLPGGGGGTAAAQVLEYCNGGRTFQVIASHRPLEPGEQVQINYDDEVRQLDSSGLSEVARRSGPTFGNVPLTIQSNGLVQGLAISLGIAIM